MENISYSVTTRNNQTERINSRDFNNEIDAVNYAKLQMKRKLGKDFKQLLKPFKGNIFAGYADKDFNFEFCIFKRIKEGEIRVRLEKYIFEL